MRIALFCRLSILVLPALAASLFAGCGGDDRDESAPALTIDSVVESPRLDPEVTLTGTVEGGALVETTLKSATTAERMVPLDDPAAPAAGTWSATFLLDPGANVFTVTAIDSAENSTRIRMEIVLAEVVLSPSNNGTLAADGVITATFREAVTAVTGNEFKLFQVETEGETEVAAAVAFDDDLKTATLRPASPLTAGLVYRAVLEGVQTEGGETVTRAVTSFTVTSSQ